MKKFICTRSEGVSWGVGDIILADLKCSPEDCGSDLVYIRTLSSKKESGRRRSEARDSYYKGKNIPVNGRLFDWGILNEGVDK